VNYEKLIAPTEVDNGFSNFFIIITEIIKHSKKQRKKMLYQFKKVSFPGNSPA